MAAAPSKSPLLGWRDAILSSASGLSPNARLLACGLAKHMNAFGGSCRPSLPLLEEETGLSRSTLKRMRAELVAAGWLSMVESRGRGYATQYQALFPPSFLKGFTVTPFETEKGSTEGGKGVTVNPQDVRGRSKPSARKAGAWRIEVVPETGPVRLEEFGDERDALGRLAELRESVGPLDVVDLLDPSGRAVA